MSVAPRAHAATWVSIVVFAWLVVCPAPGWAQRVTGPTELPKVWVLSTGGTIAGQGQSSTDLSNYKSATLLGETLVNAVPEIRRVANVRVEQIVNVASQDITLRDWLTLARRINTIFTDDPQAAGVVVTHGTSTLEETAYFLNLTVKSDRPVVVVGSMRPSTALSADGPLNLLNAVRTAASPAARGKGTLIVMNDEINSARDATKTNTYRVETFKAPELGMLGYVDEDRVSFYRASVKRHTINTEFDLGAVETLPAVEIAYSYVGASTAAMQAFIDSHAKRIVLAGTGAGVVSDVERRFLQTVASMPATSRPVVVRASRVGNGRVIHRDDYDRLGLIPADNLSPQKARILLMLALSKTSDPKEIDRIFSEY